MIVAYVVGAILVWAVIAFGLAALFRPADGDRADARLVAWLTAFWPVTGPVTVVCAIILGVICGGVWLLDQSGKGIAKVGARYIDFLVGKDN